MPLQNRVDPTGQLIVTPAKGQLMGNRGKLHNRNKEVVRAWEKQAWITCETEFKDIKRVIFGAGTYSELFFLDEATALSAGHRPCSDCQKTRLFDFKTLWRRANPSATPTDANSALRVGPIDAQLHAERIDANGRKVTFDSLYRDVPDGAFIALEGLPHLRWMGRLLRWTPEGYVTSGVKLSDGDTVTVLTPPSIVRMMSLGFTPKVHTSAEITHGARPTVGDLFRKPPTGWGLRGDPYLWQDLARVFGPVPLPSDVQTLQAMLEAAFVVLTSKQLNGPEHLVRVDRYEHGGMSGGIVSCEYWRDSGFPLIQERYATAAGN